MIETFMWGYWGWGGSTKELVLAFDAAERQRGYEPPVFAEASTETQLLRAIGRLRKTAGLEPRYSLTTRCRPPTEKP